MKRVKTCNFRGWVRVIFLSCDLAQQKQLKTNNLFTILNPGIDRDIERKGCIKNTGKAEAVFSIQGVSSNIMKFLKKQPSFASDTEINELQTWPLIEQVRKGNKELIRKSETKSESSPVKDLSVDEAINNYNYG